MGQNSPETCVRLHLYRLRIFDPACGSGNFLIIAYKELCKIEIAIFKRLHGKQTSFSFDSKIKLTQFFGLEIDDFAHETAKLSLWLAEHQMNLAFKEVFGRTRATLPLQDGGNIVCANAIRADWAAVCPQDDDFETHLIGNPPYLGARNQSKEQKSDLAEVFDGHKDYKDSDYVSAWYLKATKYIAGHNATFAFVSTNSICQGEQVGYLWPRILSRAEIGFAHQSFKWTNNAKGNAGVTCIIVGIRNACQRTKSLFTEGKTRIVKNISPYLHDGTNTIVYKTKKTLSQVPKMVMGNMARDGGHLILSDVEAQGLRAASSKASELIRPFYGANEFLNSKVRWCLWISDEALPTADRIPQIRERISKVYKLRTASKAATTNQYSSIPHKFAQRSWIPGSKIILPCHSSERRDYIPFGFLDEKCIVSNAAQVIYGADLSLFAIISSRMHMVWLRTVAGRLEERYRYSAALCYNPFPFPALTEKKEKSLEDLAFRILDERELHSEKTLSDLYDPDKMPSGLRAAIQEMDLAVERCYRKKPFTSDEERLVFLFKEYERITNKQETMTDA